MRRLVILFGCIFLIAGCGSFSHQTQHLGIHGSGNVPAEANKKKECLHEPGECGYPDPSYVDVGYEGKCSELTSSGPLVLDTSGTKIEHKNIIGNVYIGAQHVVLDHDCITDDGGGIQGGTLVQITFEGEGARIEHSTIRANNSTTESIQLGISNDGAASGVVIDHDYIYNCGECIHGGPITLTNSYIDANAEINSEHYEDIYCNNTTFVANNDVLINPHEQTAVLFCNVNNGEGGAASNHVTLTNSLLAGGGYIIYPQGNATSVGSSTISINHNHIARCVTESILNEFGSRHCVSGPDQFGYFPKGGAYGVDAYTYCPPISGQEWSFNVWDNNDEEVLCA